MLTQHEKWLRKLYKNVLHIAKDIPAFYEGKFFDLMYVNHHNPQFSPHKQYAFLRYTEKEAYLVIANFSNEEASVALNLPDLAISMAKLERGKQEAKDLLWNKRQIFTISDREAACFKIKGYDAMIVPLKVHQEELTKGEE